MNIDNKKLAKTIIYKADDKVVAVMVRGDREVNDTKVINALGGVLELALADNETVVKSTNAEVGFAGPIGIKVDTLLVDEEVSKMYNFVVGANETEYHLKNVNYGRDFEGVVGDFRKVTKEDKCPKCGGDITIARGVEVGHIFKLGTKYSDAMGANFIDEDGKSKPLIMGCYGIGINRTMAAIIEQHHDENGITWPLEIAPYHVVIVPAVMKDSAQVEAAEKLYNELKALGVNVLLDDRNERVGVKFKDSELIGIPMRITVGKKISEGIVEFKLRTGEELELIKLENVIERIEKEFKDNNLKIK